MVPLTVRHSLPLMNSMSCTVSRRECFSSAASFWRGTKVGLRLLAPHRFSNLGDRNIYYTLSITCYVLRKCSVKYWLPSTSLLLMKTGLRWFASSTIQLCSFFVGRFDPWGSHGDYPWCPPDQVIVTTIALQRLHREGKDERLPLLVGSAQRKSIETGWAALKFFFGWDEEVDQVRHPLFARAIAFQGKPEWDLL